MEEAEKAQRRAGLLSTKLRKPHNLVSIIVHVAWALYENMTHAWAGTMSTCPMDGSSATGGSHAPVRWKGQEQHREITH
jgi:hypothetical protein